MLVATGMSSITLTMKCHLFSLACTTGSKSSTNSECPGADDGPGGCEPIEILPWQVQLISLNTVLINF